MRAMNGVWKLYPKRGNKRDFGRMVALPSACFIAASALSIAIPYPFRLLPLILPLSMTVFLIAARKRGRLDAVSAILTRCIIVALTAAVLSVHLLADVVIGGAKRQFGDREGVTLTAVMREVRYSTAYSFCGVADIERADGKRVFFCRAEFSCSYAADISPSERFIMTGDVESISGGDYFEGVYPLSKGIYFKVSSDEPSYEITGRPGLGAAGFFSGISAYLSDRLITLSGRDAGSLSSALLLGQRDSLDPALKRDLRMLGLSHLIAVSGLHLTMLTGAVGRLLRRLKVPFTARVISVMLLSLLFIPLTGFMPSVIRCAVMRVFSDIFKLMRKKISSRASLLFSVAVICFFSPFSLLDVGFMMSFAATYGILTINPPMSRKIKRLLPGRQWTSRLLRGFYGGIAQSLSALVFVLPLTWLVFCEISLVSPLTNFVFIPLAMLILLFSPFVLLLGRIPLLSASAAMLLKLLCGLFTTLAGKFASGADFTVSLDYPFVPFVMLFLAAGIISARLLSNIYNKRKYLLKALPFVLTVLLFGAFLAADIAKNAGLTEVVYLSVKKNDGFAVTENGYSYLVDVSDGSYGFAYRLWSSVHDRHIDEISYYILTHYHQRHISSFCRIADQTYVRVLMLPEPISDNERLLAEALEDAALSRGCTVITYPSERGGSFAAGGIALTSGGREYISRSTHPVIAFSLSCADGGFFYAGGSFFELDGSCDFAGSPPLIVFGGHSPVIKQIIASNSLFANAHTVIATNAAVSSMLDGAERLNLLYPDENGEVVFSFGKK